MNRRLQKEFRPVLIPLVLAMGAAGLMAIQSTCDRRLLNEMEPSGVLDFLLSISPFIFYLSLALTAAIPCGTEFQHRTMPGLLTQPIPRSKIWGEKTFVAAAVALIAVLTYAVATELAYSTCARWLPLAAKPAQLFTTSALLGGTFLLATSCSAGFWTLLTRSTIGGLTLNAGSQAVLLLGVIDLMERLCGADIPFNDSRNVGALVCAGCAYAFIFQWLGWRKFAAFQVKYGLTEGAANRESFAGFKLDADWLRCRAKGSLLNLLRKEMRLNKPVFLVATVFSICWLLAFLLLLAAPRKKDALEMIFNMMTAVYLPVQFVLAGCASVSEEKSLGANVWQLTLPVASWRQWLVKLVVSATVGLGFGLLLPWLLSWGTSFRVDAGLHLIAHGNDDRLAIVLFGFCLLFFISFWASTILNNAISVAVATLVALPVLAACAALAYQGASLSSGLGTFVLSQIAAHFQLAPDYFLKENWLGSAYVIMIPLGVVLAQSLGQFRRFHPPGWRSLRPALAAVSVFFVVFFYLALYNEGATAVLNTGLHSSLEDSIRSLPSLDISEDSAHPQPISVEQLDETGKLSPLAREWLRNASISVWRSSLGARGHYIYVVNVSLPNRWQQSFSFDSSPGTPK